MSIIKRKHLINKVLIIILLFFLASCQFKEAKNLHGINYLKNREAILVINEDNKNDVIKLLGQPHAQSFDEEDTWIYIERTLSKGKYHKLGRHELKTNNTLILYFDKYGVLETKDFYNKEDINKIKFSKKTTSNNLSKKSFVETFLQSVKRKMYGNR